MGSFHIIQSTCVMQEYIEMGNYLTQQGKPLPELRGVQVFKTILNTVHSKALFISP